MSDPISLDTDTIDRLARRIAFYIRQDNQARVDAVLAAEHSRQVPLAAIYANTPIPKEATP